MNRGEIEDLKKWMFSDISFDEDVRGNGLAEKQARYLTETLVLGAKIGPRTDDLRLSVRIQGKAWNGGDISRMISPHSLRTLERASRMVGEANIDFALVENVESDSSLVSSMTPPSKLTVGEAVAHERGAFGTLGLFVRDGGSEGLLSTNHVLALLNSASRGDAIKGRLQGGASRIAALERFVPLGMYRAGDRVDAALGLLDTNVPHDGNLIRASGKQSRIRSVLDDLYILSGQRAEVAKVGSASGYTKAPLDHVSIDVDNVHVYYGGRPIRFNGLVEIEWPDFTRPGDSGSVYFMEGLDDLPAIALHIGGGTLVRSGRRTRVSYGCPMHEALASLGAQLLV